MTKKQTAKKAKKASAKKKPEIIIDNTKLSLTLAWKEVKAEYDRVLKNSAKNVKVEGFRQGKAPTPLAEQKLGRERLINKTLDNLLPTKYQELLKKEDKTPVSQPEIHPVKMEWGQDWELEIQIAERPEIKVKGYEKMVKKGLKEAKKHLDMHAKEEKEGKKHSHNHGSDDQVRLQHIYQELVNGIEPKIPELLLKEKTRQEIDRLASELEKMGLSLDDYLARQKQTFEDMSSQVAAQTLAQIQLELVLEELEKEFKIKVTDKDRQPELEKIEDKKVREKVASDPQYTRYLDQQIARKKLTDKLLQIK